MRFDVRTPHVNCKPVKKVLSSTCLIGSNNPVYNVILLDADHDGEEVESATSFPNSYDNVDVTHDDQAIIPQIVLRVEKKLTILDQPIPPAPIAMPPMKNWQTGTQFKNYFPYDMLRELKYMFKKQAGVDKFDLIQSFYACKQEEGKSISSYVLKMKSYMEQLDHLGYVLPQEINVGLILNGLTNDCSGFVRNYNMHNIGKMIGEQHALLIEYEKGLTKKDVTP
ncbi:hypothetical protein Tco_1086762 [Tanacetum coccineum]